MARYANETGVLVLLAGRSNFWTENRKWINFAVMRKNNFDRCAGDARDVPGNVGAHCPMARARIRAKPVGQLVLFADTAVFADPASPENCTLRNRFKAGDNVGFRLYAVDGGTNKPEESATVVVHITSGGKKYDLPALYRAVPHKNEKGVDMPIRPGMWTAKWARAAGCADRHRSIFSYGHR